MERSSHYSGKTVIQAISVSLQLLFMLFFFFFVMLSFFTMLITNKILQLIFVNLFHNVFDFEVKDAPYSTPLANI